MSNRILERGAQNPGSSSVNPDIVRGFEIPRTVYIASTPLPGGGAFTGDTAFAVPAGIRWITFWVTYTRGAAGGYPIFRIFHGNGVEEGNDIVIEQTAAVVQPIGNQSFYLQELSGPVPATNDPLVYVIPVRVAVGSTFMRLRAAEAGVVGTPGTIAVTYAGGT